MLASDPLCHVLVNVSQNQAACRRELARSCGTELATNAWVGCDANLAPPSARRHAVRPDPSSAALLNGGGWTGSSCAARSQRLPCSRITMSVVRPWVGQRREDSGVSLHNQTQTLWTCRVHRASSAAITATTAATTSSPPPKLSAHRHRAAQGAIIKSRPQAAKSRPGRVQ